MSDIISATPKDTGTMQVFNSHSGWELAQRMAKGLAASTLVPEIYRNNVPNCLIALEMAHRIGASPMMVMQNLYVVYGRPGWSAKFLIATFNQCGRFTAIRYRFTGTPGTDSWGCIAYATEKATGEVIEGPEVTIALAKAEGWYNKQGSKWKTIPQKMLMYRTAGWMVDTHAPELSMGLQTSDALEDMGDDVPLMSVTQVARDPEALASLESSLLADATGEESDIAQLIHDRMIRSATQEELNQAWELGGPDYVPSPAIVDLYNKRAEELKE